MDGSANDAANSGGWQLVERQIYSISAESGYILDAGKIDAEEVSPTPQTANKPLAPALSRSGERIRTPGVRQTGYSPERATSIAEPNHRWLCGNF